MNNYVDLIKLNNNIEKVKFYKDDLNANLIQIEKLVSELKNNYKSNFNKNDFLINIKINNKKIIVYQFNKIKFLDGKLETYRLTNTQVKGMLGD